MLRLRLFISAVLLPLKPGAGDGIEEEGTGDASGVSDCEGELIVEGRESGLEGGLEGVGDTLAEGGAVFATVLG